MTVRLCVVSDDVERKYQVPAGVDIAAGWAWRLLLIAAAGGLLIWLMRYFSEITVPVAVAVLGTALTIGAVDWLVDHRVPRLLATFIVVITMLAAFFGMLALVGQQLSTQVDDLRANVVEGITQVQDWARTGPLGLSDAQLQSWIDEAKSAISTTDSSVLTRISAVGATITHAIAGFFIALFSAFFFLYEGDRIWSWVVALFPRAARDRVYSSGQTAWRSLTAFVRATVVVALIDAMGIAFAAWALGRAAHAGDRRPRVPRCLRADRRCADLGHGRGVGRAGGPRARGPPCSCCSPSSPCSSWSRTCCSRS